ncbi:hypothetical protein CEUSTIGMA_g13590.t1, partial [Chlamydomonas eustigma]
VCAAVSERTAHTHWRNQVGAGANMPVKHERWQLYKEDSSDDVSETSQSAFLNTRPVEMPISEIYAGTNEVYDRKYSECTGENLDRRQPGRDGSYKMNIVYEAARDHAIFDDLSDDQMDDMMDLICSAFMINSNFSTSQTCIEEILSMWSSNRQVSEEFRKHIPSTYNEALKMMQQLEPYPDIWAYDVCPKCDRLFRSLMSKPDSLKAIQYGHNKFMDAIEASQRHGDDKVLLEDIHDGTLFAKLGEVYPIFMKKPLSILLGLAVDGFCPFKNPAGGGIIPGPSVKNFHSFLEPLVDELGYAWESGIEVQFNLPKQSQPQGEQQHGGAAGGSDTFEAVHDLARVMCCHIMGDYRGLPDVLSMIQSPSPNGCFYCKLQGFLIHTGKCLYPGLWRWLPLGHSDRCSNKIKINPQVKMSRTRSDIDATGPRSFTCSTEIDATVAQHQQTPEPPLRSVEELRPYQLGAHPGTSRLSQYQQEATVKAEANIFWRLPYFWNLGPSFFSSYDAMHTIGGVIESLFAALLRQTERKLVVGRPMSKNITEASCKY